MNYSNGEWLKIDKFEEWEWKWEEEGVKREEEEREGSNNKQTVFERLRK